MPFAGATVRCTTLILLVLLCASPPCLAGGAPTHNITAILAASPEFTAFSAALAAANLTGKIDGQPTITVLAIDDAAVQRLGARGLAPDAVGRVLSLHVLLDYFDDAKIKALINSTSRTQATSFYQASGAAPGGSGMVSIVPIDGPAGDGPKGAAFTAADAGGHVVFYEKSVKESPYDIAVLQVSDAMESPSAEGKALAPAPVAAPVPAPVVAPSPQNQTAAPPPKPAAAPSPKNQTASPPKPAGAPSPTNQTAPPPKQAAEPAEAPEADDQPPADDQGQHKSGAAGTAPWTLGAAVAAAVPAVVVFLL